MTNYLIIDSNKNYAEKLHSALPSLQGSMKERILDPVTSSDLTSLSADIHLQIEKTTKAILLINAEGSLQGRYLQNQSLVELAFWLRCKYKLTNPIVFYSLQSVNSLLKAIPEHFILLSPGSYHFRLPMSREELARIPFLKPLENLDSIRPYLKARINLTQTRHRYANYIGLDLMMFLAQKVWGRENELLDQNNPLYRHLTKFWSSLDYYLLRTYFNLSLDLISPRILTRLKVGPPNGSILLIDDLAGGWKPVITQMLYGESVNQNIGSIPIHTKSKMLDLNRTKEELKRYIKAKKPHLILMDLRLSDEEGKKELEALGGYQLLRFVKQNSHYRGLPVIVFTASGNAEVTKRLIQEGAEAVWTKPGLDENLNSGQVVERYETLIRYVQSVLNRFDAPIIVESDQDVEKSRLKVLEKIEFLKYRARLRNLKSANHYFNGFTDIFIDTNVVIDSADSICNVYKLAQICDTAKHTISVEGTDFEISAPKVVLLNFVVDEIIHWSKAIDPSKRFFWKLGLMAYDVVRGLFQDSLVRTEFNTFKEASNLPDCTLTRTSRDAFADPELIEDIHRIVSGTGFKLRRRFRQGRSWATEEKYAMYKTANPKILLITNEAMNVAGKIPHELTNKVNGIINPLGAVKIINLATFAKQIEAIPL